MTEDIKRSILTQLYRLNRRMRQHNEANTGVEDLTLHQMQALFFVKQNQPVRMGELAEELHISPGSASLLADRLVESGWLTRSQDEQDRRTVRVELSEEAKKKLGQMFKRTMENAGQLLDALSPKDLHEFDRILGELLK